MFMIRRTFAVWCSTSKPKTRAVPSLGQQQRRQDLDERRLARAVGPEQAEELAGLDGQVDAVERGHRVRAWPCRRGGRRARRWRGAGSRRTRRPRGRCIASGSGGASRRCGVHRTRGRWMTNSGRWPCGQRVRGACRPRGGVPGDGAGGRPAGIRPSAARATAICAADGRVVLDEGEVGLDRAAVRELRRRAPARPGWTRGRGCRPRPSRARPGRWPPRSPRADRVRLRQRHRDQDARAQAQSVVARDESGGLRRRNRPAPAPGGRDRGSRSRAGRTCRSPPPGRRASPGPPASGPRPGSTWGRRR